VIKFPYCEGLTNVVERPPASIPSTTLANIYKMTCTLEEHHGKTSVVENVGRPSS
jgi:hypothetical protein